MSQVAMMKTELSRSEVRRYYRKTRRESSSWECERGGAFTWLGSRDLDLQVKKKLMEAPDQFFDGRQPLLKDGNTCTVVGVEEGGKVYVLKRYNPKSLLYRWIHVFSNPRALLNWSNGHVLQFFGVKTPRPLACLIFKSYGFLFRKAYVLMEHVDGESLSSIPRSKILSGEHAEIPEQFAQLWWELDSLDATHGDFKASNFMVDREGQLILIDLDSLQFHRSVDQKNRKQEKDMRRCFKNWKNDPELINLFKDALDARKVVNSSE